MWHKYEGRIFIFTFCLFFQILYLFSFLFVKDAFHNLSVTVGDGDIAEHLCCVEEEFKKTFF